MPISFKNDKEHLKLKLDFQRKHPKIPQSWCNNNYYFAYRCVSVDYGKHYVRVSDHTKLEIRNREAKIRELNNDLSEHILNFGLRANNMKKEDLLHMAQDVINEIARKRQENERDHATVETVNWDECLTVLSLANDTFYY